MDKIQRFQPCLVMEYSKTGDYVRVEKLQEAIRLLQEAREELGSLRRDAMNTLASLPDETLMQKLDEFIIKMEA